MYKEVDYPFTALFLFVAACCVWCCSSVPPRRVCEHHAKRAIAVLRGAFIWVATRVHRTCLHCLQQRRHLHHSEARQPKS